MNLNGYRGTHQVAMPVIELKKKVMGPVLTVSMLATRKDTNS